jgi:hypothetical protein
VEVKAGSCPHRPDKSYNINRRIVVYNSPRYIYNHLAMQRKRCGRFSFRFCYGNQRACSLRSPRALFFQTPSWCTHRGNTEEKAFKVGGHGNRKNTWEVAHRGGPAPSSHRWADYPALFATTSCSGNLHHFLVDQFSRIYTVREKFTRVFTVREL